MTENQNFKIDLTSLNPVSIGVGILTNIASAVLTHYAQRIENTVVVKALKHAGIIPHNFYDRLTEILIQSAAYFFNQHPVYQRQSIIDFLQDPITSKQMADHILDGIPLDRAILEKRLDDFFVTDADALYRLRVGIWNKRQIIDDFFIAYRHVRRQSLDQGQIALLEAIESGEQRIISAIRQSNEALFQQSFQELLTLVEKVNQRISPYFRVVRDEAYPPASIEEIDDFYKGLLPLNWNIITAKAIIQRDQRDTVMTELSATIQSNVEVVCFTGEAGDGKSTLAWDIALEIARRHNCRLLQFYDNQTPEAWYILEEALTSNSKPVVVLVDDLFRDSRFVQGLQNLPANLPIRIIATSRANEVPNHLRLPRLRLISLMPPSETEKRLVLEQLHINQLSVTQSERLKKASNWLVLMMETAQGESFKKIIVDNILRLKQLDEVVYHAYEYISFAGQFDRQVPEKLIESIDTSGSFYKLWEHPAAAGLIFRGSSTLGESFLRPSHALIAQEAFKNYRRDPLNVLDEMVRNVSVQQRTQRRFIIYLLSSLTLNDHKHLVQNFVQNRHQLMETLILASGHVDLFTHLIPMYRHLDKPQIADEIIIRALDLVPNDSNDWESKLAYLNRYGTKQQILTAIEQLISWLENHDEDVNARSSYLALLKKDKGSSDQIVQAIENTQLWLVRHDDDVNVRSNYLALVKDKGNSDQLEQAMEATHRWLEHHDTDMHIRSSYVAMVKEKGSLRQIEQTVENTQLWLGRHDEDVNVRSNYLALVKDKGTPHQIEQALEYTRLWLALHDGDIEVRRNYLSIVKDTGTPEQIEQVMEKTLLWLALHDDDGEVRRTYLELINDKGAPEQVEQALEYTRLWLDQHDANIVVRRTYLTLLKNRGTADQIKQALENTRLWLERHNTNVNVYSNYISLVNSTGTPEQVEEVMEKTRVWLTLHDEDTEVRRNYLSLVKDKGTSEQIAQTVEDTRRWLQNRNKNIHPALAYSFGSLLIKLGIYEEASTYFRYVCDRQKSNVQAGIQLAWALYHMNEKDEALDELRRAHWWGKNMKQEHEHDTYHQLGVYYYKEKAYTKAVGHFTEAYRLKPDYYDHSIELGRALITDGQNRQAVKVLERILPTVSQAIVPEKHQEILELIAQAKQQM